MSKLLANIPCKIPVFYICCEIAQDKDPVCIVAEGFVVDKAGDGKGYVIETSNGERRFLFRQAVYFHREIAEKYLLEHEDYLVDQALIECEYLKQTNQW